MVLRNEMYMIVVMISMSRYSLVFSETLKKFIRELHGFANHVNTSPNSLGRLDNHKINFVHRQLHPSMIGVIDLLDYSKDVGQSGMISPWADISLLSEVNTNKYPNIKYDLFEFIQNEFPNPGIRFNCNNIEEYNRLLDKLVWSTYMNIEYHVNSEESSA